MARAIAGEIQLKLRPQDKEKLASVGSVDPEAYQAYLLGRLPSQRSEALTVNPLGPLLMRRKNESALESWPDGRTRLREALVHKAGLRAV